MIINEEKIINDFVNRYWYLFEDSSLLLEDISINKKIQDIKEKYKKKKESLEKSKDSALEKIKDFGLDLGKEVSEEYRERLQDKVRRMKAIFIARMRLLNKQTYEEIKNVKKISKLKSGAIVSGITLASLIIFTSYQIFKRDKKIIEDKCSKLSGKRKLLCVKKIEIYLTKDRLDFLEKSIYKCKYSKDPVKCRSEIDKEILRLKGIMKDKLSELGSRMVSHYD